MNFFNEMLRNLQKIIIDFLQTIFEEKKLYYLKPILK